MPETVYVLLEFGAFILALWNFSRLSSFLRALTRTLVLSIARAVVFVPASDDSRRVVRALRDRTVT